MSEEKPKRQASFGIEITEVGKDGYAYFRVYDKGGTIIQSADHSNVDAAKFVLARLRKVCKNRYTATKVIQN